MKEVQANESKNSSDIQFSEIDEVDGTRESRPYDNLLMRSNMLEPSQQESQDRDQSQYMSQMATPIHDMDQSPLPSQKIHQINLSNHKNHKSIDLSAKRKKNYTVQQQYENK